MYSQSSIAVPAGELHGGIHQLGAASVGYVRADFGQVARGHGGASLAVSFVGIPH